MSNILAYGWGLLSTAFAWVDIPVIILGCLAHRVCGGWLGFLFPNRGLPARLIWVGFIGAVIAVYSGQTGGPLIAVAVGGVLVGYAERLIPHGRQMDCGRMPGATASDDYHHLAAIGVERMLLLLTPLAVFDARVFWLIYLGFLHPGCYWLGWNVLPYKETWKGNRYIVDGQTAWAELIWGGIKTAAIIAAARLFV